MFQRDEWIERAKEYGDKYDYKTKYCGSNKMVTITCPKHGDFEQRLLIVT